MVKSYGAKIGGNGIAVRVQKRIAIRVCQRLQESRIDDSYIEFLGEESLLVNDTGLEIVNALHDETVPPRARVGEPAVLGNGLQLQVTQVGERIAAWIIVELIVPHEGAKGEHRVWTHYMVPRWSDVEGSDLRALVLPDRRDYRSNLTAAYQ